MRVVDYDASRRADVADLMARVWGERPDERELEWFYERNPVRPASVLLGEEDGRVIATVAISFQRMSIAGEEIEVGMPLRVATDPAFRGRGVFRTLEEANEERVRGFGVPLLLTVPNAASSPVFLERLGWTALPPLRVWARVGVLPVFDSGPRPPHGYDRVLRDDAWVRWRFVQAPRPYTVLRPGGHVVAGRRGRIGTVAAVAGSGLGLAVRSARAPIVIAIPPPWERRRYLGAGFVPTPKTFTLLGRSLDGTPLPARPHFDLGDLDFV